MKLKSFTPNKNTHLHLYVASACPFCHRVIATLELTGLSRHLSYTWMQNIKGIEGWAIDPDDEPAFHVNYLSTVYDRLDPKSEHPHAVPLLVDLSEKSVLSTSSADMTHFFSRGMNAVHEISIDLYPDHLCDDIEKLNSWLHDNINRAVYLAGFSTNQVDYESRVKAVFQSLDELEKRLTNQIYLFGDELTESDLYLFATLVRFDEIYFSLFKCSYRLIKDYSALSRYMRRLLSIPELKRTVDIKSFKAHYYRSVMHVGDNPMSLNPMGTVPVEMLPQ